MIPQREMYIVFAYDHREFGHNRGAFETEDAALTEKNRIERISVPKTFQRVEVSRVEVGV